VSVRRSIVAVLILLAFVPLTTRPALAHGFEGRVDLPVPLWLYLYGSAAAVLLSFLVIGLFLGKEHAPHRYSRFDLLKVRAFRMTLASRPFLSVLRFTSVVLFLLIIFAGLFGNQSPGNNFAPTFVWIVWWVGFSFFVGLVGNLWPLVNPWKVLFEWADGLALRLGVEGGLELNEPYPKRWGVWPALMLFFAFVWIELVFEHPDTPLNVVLFALLYSAITWTAMVLFGKETWLRHGEVFSVFFGVLARLAPTEARVTDPELCRECGCRAENGGCVNCYECFAHADPKSRQLNLRPPAVGLGRPEEPMAGLLAFVVFMLSAVTYDGLMVTPLWAEVQKLPIPALNTVGLLTVPLAFGVLYLGFVKLSQLLGGGTVSFRRLAAAYVFSLVPITFAYQVAHYYTLLLFNGQMIFLQVSDPFGWGWDLVGTASYQVNNAVVGAAFVWYSQVALIVAGHVLAVYLAHAIALRLFEDPGRALRSQYPILVLMVLYTVLSLWILSQPIVE
jgi:polyferredoxin